MLRCSRFIILVFLSFNLFSCRSASNDNQLDGMSLLASATPAPSPTPSPVVLRSAAVAVNLCFTPSTSLLDLSAQTTNLKEIATPLSQKLYGEFPTLNYDTQAFIANRANSPKGSYFRMTVNGCGHGGFLDFTGNAITQAVEQNNTTYKAALAQMLQQRKQQFDPNLMDDVVVCGQCQATDSQTQGPYSPPAPASGEMDVTIRMYLSQPDQIYGIDQVMNAASETQNQVDTEMGTIYRRIENVVANFAHYASAGANPSPTPMPTIIAAPANTQQ